MLACFTCGPAAQIIFLFTSLFLLCIGILWAVVKGCKFFHRKEKLYLTLVSTLLAVVLCYLIYPSYKASRGSVYTLNRQLQLIDWYQEVISFVDAEGKLPSSLYEVSKSDLDLDTMDDLYVSDVYRYPDKEKYEKMLDDPNYYFEEVEYAFVRHKQGWFVIELTTDQHYMKQMMIDDQQRIYSFEEMKQR